MSTTTTTTGAATDLLARPTSFSTAQRPVKIRLDRVTQTFPVRPEAGHRHGTTLTALQDVTLEIHDGEFLALVGPSGSGKSTLLDLLGGLTAPTSGRILIDGNPVSGTGHDRGIVFQQYALLPWKTALDNIAFGLTSTGAPRREARERARTYLDLVGLSGFADRYPHELSGGMKQRVAIARSLVYEPDILLMDEPFGALDAQTRERLQAELLGIWQHTGTTVVFITHSIEEAVFLGQRVAVLDTRPGRLKTVVRVDLDRSDPTADIRSDPAFVAARHHVWELLHSSGSAAVDQESHRTEGSTR
ncbi:ABC transporter ATP-binding protein [Kocuria arenosa]|uniref:ABC transporter ATP-binding protein n=1 Tax=Kocuria arenosa TaxID=3071446 RepID=UPI0034D72A20